MDFIYIILSLVLVFGLFGFIQWREKSRNSEQQLSEKQIEAIARKVIDGYGRTIAREEARKVYNETLQ